MADLRRRLVDPSSLRPVRIVLPQLPSRDRAPRTSLRLPRPLRVDLPLGRPGRAALTHPRSTTSRPDLPTDLPTHEERRHDG